MGSIVHPATIRPAPGRLDGWKAIGAYLGRDRSTVIRWARDRALPVHRLPGGKTATVFALRHELDRWAGIPEALPEMRPERTARRRWVAAALLASLAVGVRASLALRAGRRG